MSETAEAGRPEISADLFLGGRVLLLQPRGGHRAGLDAALLQALVPAAAEGQAIDLGAGAGTVAFSLAARIPAMRTVAVEIDPDLAALSRSALQAPENAAFSARVTVINADAAARRPSRETAGLPDQSADWVLMNPPYDSAGQQRPSPDAARRRAHVATPDLLPEWTRTAAGLLKSGGFFGAIHRAAALPALLHALSPRFGDFRVLPVMPSAIEAASRVLVRARLGSRAPLRLCPQLVLHDESGAWTDEADAVLRGHADLAARLSD